jgi:hypothetical protein
VAQGIGPEFKPQYHKKKKKERKELGDHSSQRSMTHQRTLVMENYKHSPPRTSWQAQFYFSRWLPSWMKPQPKNYVTGLCKAEVKTTFQMFSIKEARLPLL